jgi:hypothetical protein
MALDRSKRPPRERARQGTDDEQRIAVRGRLSDRLGADIAAAARPVVDDEGLTEPFREPLTHQAREDVDRASGPNADDNAHRTRRIGLRPSGARDGWQRGSARRQMQELRRGSFTAFALKKVCDDADYSPLMFAALMTLGKNTWSAACVSEGERESAE